MKFKEMVNAPNGSKFILQGNAAFALGVMHAGYHAADGYPGTPSTEVIDKSLKFVQDEIKVGWSVNEAVATAVGIGHSIAGFDTVVTMKTPGVFQAGDTITTSAFYTTEAGAFVLYVASDYIPSSTQHVIDLKYFFSSSRIPVLEPRNHQEMYDIAEIAADMSKEFRTPVVVLASGILSHSEGLVKTRERRKVEPKKLKKDLKDWMGMPFLARERYNEATQVRIPEIQKWFEKHKELTKEEQGENLAFAIIVSGESDMIVRESLCIINANPSILSMASVYPLPNKRIQEFCQKQIAAKKKIFIFEDGDKFVEDKIRLLGFDITGKGENSVITNWTPQLVIDHIAKHIDGIACVKAKKEISLKPLRRPPSICPGCPYRALGIVVEKLKKQKKIYASFGDIGCSTLLYFQNAIDTVLCMGASDSMRQGFVLSRPEMASKTISIIGDSCECHSGLDSTRNAIFRNVPGVKIVLDNRITAMTGGQPAPSSKTNLAGNLNKFNMLKVLQAESEEARVIAIDSYDLKSIESELKSSLELAEKGIYTILVLQGPCIHEIEAAKKTKVLKVNYDKCRKCGLCNICPGIESGVKRFPSFTNLCINCAGNKQVCMQICPFGAIEIMDDTEKENKIDIAKISSIEQSMTKTQDIPKSLRLAIRGIGGQGCLFFGKILSEVALNTPYINTNIVKGDTHGMAQLGGSVISTFACGNVNSPVFAPDSVDILVVMEASELLIPGFLELLKPEGKIIFNTFCALPVNTKQEEYPSLSDIENAIKSYDVIKINANKIAYEYGDTTGKTANVVILGLVSNLEPFNTIAEDVWLSALMNFSTEETIQIANQRAFYEGRKLSIR